MDLNASPIWTKQHTFLKPVLFSTGQMFNGANLKLVNQKRGSIIAFDGTTWNIVPEGLPSQILTIQNGLPVWGHLDTKILHGVVSIKNGGTGISQYQEGDILIGNNLGVLSTLALGTDGQILQIKNNKIVWDDIPVITGIGKSSYLPVWSSQNTLCASDIKIFDKNLILNSIESNIVLGNMTINGNKKFTVLTKNNLFTIDNNLISLHDKDNNLLIEFKNGVLTKGVIPHNTISGVINVSQGGTGMGQYNSGDLIVAVDNQCLGVLSSQNVDDLYLKVVNGKPQWAPLTNINNITNSSNLTLNKGTLHRAPLQFQLGGTLTSTPHPGAMEWDGDLLFITNQDKNRKRILYHGEDIQAKSEGLSKILTLDMGGLGNDHSNASPGSILFIENNHNTGALSPKSGYFLRVDPTTNLPTWSTSIMKIINGEGINTNNNLFESTISINQSESFTPSWQGRHIFEQGIILGNDTQICIPKNSISGLAQIFFEQSIEPTQKQHGDMWFDNDLFMYVDGSTVNITETKRACNNQIQYLQICNNETPVKNSKRKSKYIIPYGSDGYSNIKWKIVRIDLRIEDCPIENEAQLNILINNQSILEQLLVVKENMNMTFVQQFITPYVFSGDLIELEFGETGNSDCWNVFLTITNESI